MHDVTEDVGANVVRLGSPRRITRKRTLVKIVTSVPQFDQDDDNATETEDIPLEPSFTNRWSKKLATTICAWGGISCRFCRIRS